MEEPRIAVFADERQAQIAELVTTQGRARNGELARRFGVSEPTIRKDLSTLQRRGLVKRTHGGAIAPARWSTATSPGREETQRDAKRAIAARLSRPDPNGDAVFLDSGSTIAALASALAAEPPGRRSNLSVLTTSPDVARSVAELCRGSSTCCSAASCGRRAARSSARSRCTTCSASRSTSPSSA